MRAHPVSIYLRLMLARSLKGFRNGKKLLRDIYRERSELKQCDKKRRERGNISKDAPPQFDQSRARSGYLCQRKPCFFSNLFHFWRENVVFKILLKPRLILSGASYTFFRSCPATKTYVRVQNQTDHSPINPILVYRTEESKKRNSIHFSKKR